MIAVKQILFPTDFSTCANQAMAYTLELARRFGAKLHVLHAMDLGSDDPLNASYYLHDRSKVRELMKKAANKLITTALEKHDIEELSIHRVCKWGTNPGRVILEYAAERDIDIIVLGTHGHRGLQRVFLGSVAEQVVRRARCPVITIREQLDRLPRVDLRNILVPTDFSDHSLHALLHAKHLAASTGARLQVLHVTDPAVYHVLYHPTPGSLDETKDRLAIDATEKLMQLKRETGGPDVNAEIYVESGHTVRSIVNFANNRKTDLIVLGSHGRTGAKHFLLGSVAEKVVRHALCPVLTVKAFGKSLIKAETVETREAAAV